MFTLPPLESRAKKIFTNLYLMFFYVARRLLALLEFFLLLRLLLKFLGANPETFVVKLIYQYSDILISPFRAILPNFYWRGKMIEISTAVAMLGYAILIFIIFQLLKKPIWRGTHYQ